MAVITGKTTTRLAEVDSSFKALRGVKFPARDAYRVAGRATNTTYASGARFFAFRWPSAIKAAVVTFVSATLQSLSNSPAAEIELGLDLHIVRGWNTAAPPASSNVVIATPSPLQIRRGAIKFQSLIGGTAASYDIRFGVSTGAGTSVVTTADNFTADASSFCTVREKELIQAAGTPKEQEVTAQFDARHPGTYPIILSQFEGILVTVSPGNFGSVGIQAAMEWQEVPYDRLDSALAGD
jgi:hypothetical protein